MKIKRVLLQCATAVNRDAVSRDTRGGVEFITIKSFTLPDNIVMNGILYPTEAVNDALPTLERSLAPIEHPTDDQGNLILASDPHAINNFYAGAYNVNVAREGNRIRSDIEINVPEALKSERGRRLLDRVAELESNDKAAPIHTSVTVLTEIQELDQPLTNAAGQDYQLIATNFIFDHNAILLDSIGAAQPDQGVGMAVNNLGDGVAFDVQHYLINEHTPTNPGVVSTEVTGLSHDTIREMLREALTKQIPDSKRDESHVWIDDVFPEVVVYDFENQLFSAPYQIDEQNKVARIVGLPTPVDRQVSFVTRPNEDGIMVVKVNGAALSKRLNDLIDADERDNADVISAMASAAGIEVNTVHQILGGGIDNPPEARLRAFATVLGVSAESLISLTTQMEANAMKFLENALKKAGISIEGMNQDAMVLAYEKLIGEQAVTKANAAADDKDKPPAGALTAKDVADIVTNAVKPMADQLAAIKSNEQAGVDAETTRCAELVGNSKNYPSIDVDAAKAIPLATLQGMAARCGTSTGLPGLQAVQNAVSGGGDQYADMKIPE